MDFKCNTIDTYLLAPVTLVGLKAKQAEGFVAKNACVLAISTSTFLHILQSLNHFAVQQGKLSMAKANKGKYLT